MPCQGLPMEPLQWTAVQLTQELPYLSPRGWSVRSELIRMLKAPMKPIDVRLKLDISEELLRDVGKGMIARGELEMIKIKGRPHYRMR